jgi:DNA-binding Lrp family transcriptional regulator
MDALEVHATDLEIVDAVQISPRASWASVARAIGVSEVTVARRWKSLESRRLAWIGVALHPAVSYGSFIEIRCEGRQMEAIATSLGRHPDVITVGYTTGDYNLYCLTISTTLDGVLRCVHGGLPELLDANQIRISLYRQMTGGVDWRQGILSASDERQLHDNSKSRAHESLPTLTDRDRDLFLLLGRDGRSSPTELARALNVSPGAVARRLEQLQASNQIVFRCDVARPYFDLPLNMILLMKAPALLAEQTSLLLGHWRETRFCASVVGTANIILIVGLHDLVDAEGILRRLSLEHPEVELVDQRVATRMTKVYGRLIDEFGRSEGIVPVDPWTRVRRSR